MSKNYFWGAPANWLERDEAVQRIRELRPDSDLTKLHEMLQGYMNRVTDKTAGLQSTAGIVLAISLFAMDREATTYAVVGSLLAVWALVLLSLNLGTVWRKDQANWAPTQEYFGEQVQIFSRRVVRLQLALWLVVTSSILSAVSLANAVI